MLFPTYREGEGFPGVIIDAYISSLPVVASNHNFNSEFIKSQETGFLFNLEDKSGLEKTMKEIINAKEKLKFMRKKAFEESKKYNINLVLNGVIYDREK